MGAAWLSAAHEPFDRRSALAWLIEEARWRDEDEPSDGRTIPLLRGQVCHSLRFLARAWKWDDSKVRRFLAAAASAKALTFSSSSRATLITICNYDEIQQRIDVTTERQSASVKPRRCVADTNENKGKKEKTLPTEECAMPQQADLLSATVVPMPVDMPHRAMELWNAFAARTVFAPVKLNSASAAYRKRRTGLRRVLAEVGGLAGFEAVLDRIAASALCRGEKSGWKADLDWLCDRAVAVERVMSGKYDDRPEPGRAPSYADSLAALDRLDAKFHHLSGQPEAGCDPIIEHKAESA